MPFWDECRGDGFGHGMVYLPSIIKPLSEEESNGSGLYFRGGAGGVAEAVTFGARFTNIGSLQDKGRRGAGIRTAALADHFGDHFSRRVGPQAPAFRQIDRPALNQMGP